MNQLFNDKYLLELKSNKKYLIIRIIVASIIFVTGFTLLMVFKSRATKNIWPIFLAVLSTLYLGYLIYLYVVSINPLRRYLKVINNALNRNQVENTFKIVRIEEKLTHYQGIPMHKIVGVEIDEEKETFLYVEAHLDNPFIKDKTYKVVSYRGLVIAYEEII